MLIHSVKSVVGDALVIQEMVSEMELFLHGLGQTGS